MKRGLATAFASFPCRKEEENLLELDSFYAVFNTIVMEDKTSEIKSEIAQHKPRDQEGHFIHSAPASEASAKAGGNPIEKFIEEHTSYHKSQDDILDVHVGNPLRKITQLLEEIKKQKAFSFTLKGSLGIMGVALALSVFGIFGGGKILCDKGIQSQIGTIKILNIYDNNETINPFNNILNFFNSKEIHKRTVLIKTDNSVIIISYSKNVSFSQYNNYPVIVTGNYDSCSQALTVNNPNGIEIYTK